MRTPPITAGLLLISLSLSSCDRNDSERADAPAALSGPKIVQEMVAAHGRLEKWRAAPTVSFEDEFAAPGAPPAVSHVTVEQGRRRSYMDVPGTTSTLAWDGERVWTTSWASPAPPRFVAQLNYYFLNLPWLTQDPGVKLVEEGTGTVLGDSVPSAIVMMTFEPGTGDTPDDYYRLYIDPATKRLRACDYVVTYGSLMPPGAESSPEHHLVFESYETVNGLLVPTSYTIYEDGKVYATCKVRDWSFDQPFDESRMSMPSAASIDTTTP